jgi:hypothetical protein
MPDVIFSYGTDIHWLHTSSSKVVLQSSALASTRVAIVVLLKVIRACFGELASNASSGKVTMRAYQSELG